MSDSSRQGRRLGGLGLRSLDSARVRAWLRSLTGRILVPCALLAAVVAVAFVQQRSATRQLEGASHARTAADSDIARVRELEKLLLDMETGIRGFVITRDQRFLQPWQAARRAFPVRAGQLVQVQHDNPGLQRVARRVEQEGNSYIHDYAASLIDAVNRRRGHPGSIAMTAEGKRRVDALRADLATVTAQEQAEALATQRSADAAASRASSWQLAGAAGLLLLILLSVAYLTRAISRPIRRVERAADRVAGGDLSARVAATGADELSRLGHSFNAMAASLEAGRRELSDQAAELRSANAFLDSVLENIPNMIFVKDAGELRFVRFNRAGEELLGHSRREMIGRNDYDFFPREEADFFTGKDRKVLEGGELLDIPEEPVQTRDGTVRYLHTKKIPILDTEGRAQYLLGISEDITERKRADEVIRAAMQEAERANRAKSEFLSRMSHELRTPLNSILGFAQLLEMDGLAGDQAEQVRYIVKSGRHLLELINEVLDISRVEAGDMAISLEPVPVDAVLDDVLAMVGPLASERRIEIETVLTNCELHVHADQQRLKQVLLNLLANAIKYNREGGNVEVACERVGDSRLRVLVRDTGPGIPDERLDDLFAPFERLGAEQGEIEGTGLGLALSKRLVELMHGTLTVESQLGVGSTFGVELALAGESDGSAAAAADPAQGEEPAPSAFARLLYIEDNLSNLELIERVLRRRPQISVETAMQGQLGIELARQQRPDLILLDLHLPDLRGEDVLERLKGDPHTGQIPVIVVSADATPGQERRLRDAGAHAYVTKPLDIRAFLAAIDDALSGDSAART